MKRNPWSPALKAVIASCLLIGGSAALGQDEGAAEGDIPEAIAAEETPINSEEMMERAVADYQGCIKDVIASETPVDDKAAEFTASCGEQRENLSAVFPQDYADFFLLNMDRRIDAVLSAMKAAQGVIEDAAEDGAAIAEALAD